MVTLCPSPPDLPLPTLFPPLEGLTDNSPPALLSAVLEGFNEGILIINQAGQLLHANHLGQTLAHQLKQWEGTDMAPVPPSLWTICSYLLEGRDLFPGNPLILTQDFRGPQGYRLRARVQWLDGTDSETGHFLVMLEDPNSAALSQAQLKALELRLTPREQQVWRLRQRQCSVQSIADELYLSLATVKRHLRQIYSKRRQIGESLQFQDS
ncbi:MAG: LuxR C-terminal-related transcriptional regulator [Cyanobacteriota bacterium]|nr:LuxR C-terminal-related transcriptional regulator [Cyanobacteriota bacterium]